MSDVKKCKHCKSEIPKKAKVCPICKKKQSGILKTVLIVFLVFFLIGVLFGGSEEEPQKVETKTEVAEKKQEEITETKFGIGDVVNYKDVEVAVLSYTESNGNDWVEPKDGYVFVYPLIEISNKSDEEITISSMLSFNNYCDDYLLEYSSNALMAISTEDDMQALDMNISSGKKAKGCLGLEVPADWKVIEIYYKDNAWLDSNFSFVIEK